MRFSTAPVQLSHVTFSGKTGTRRDSGPKRDRGSSRPAITVERLELRQFLSAGALDPTFGSGGKVVDGSLVAASDVAVQPDGKILVASGKLIVRYTTSGQLDATFGRGGEVKSVVGAQDFFLQSDGKLVVAGASAGNMAAARYNADGSLDTSFGSGGVTVILPPGNDNGSTANEIAEQSDGSVILAGETFGKISPSSEVVVARLTPSGQLDTSFGASGFAKGAGSGTVTGSVDDIAVESDNRIVVADHSRGGNTGTAFLQRLNADGSVDPSLQTAFSATGAVYFDVAIQPDGKILAAGLLNASTVLKRYNADGTVDPSFSFTNPLPGPNPVNSMAVQSDGRIVLSIYNSGTTPQFYVARLLPNGQFDTTFGTGGHTSTAMDAGVANKRVALQRDGRIIVAGGSTSELAVARYTTDSASTPPPSDSTPPVATILAAPRLQRFAKSYSFTVTYHDNVALDVSTLDNNDIVVTGPNGFSAPAQFLVASTGRHASTRVVTYAVQGPNRRWNAAADGLYIIHLQPGQVLDTSGNPVSAGDVSMFHVVIPDSTSAFIPPTMKPSFVVAPLTPPFAAVREERQDVLSRG